MAWSSRRTSYYDYSEEGMMVLSAPGNASSQQFVELAQRCLKGIFEFSPHNASWLGLHEYDGRVPDRSKERIGARIKELEGSLAELDAMDVTGFDPGSLFDYLALKQGLNAERFQLAEMREYRYNPMHVLALTDVMGYIKRNFAPFPDRVRKLTEYERGIPTLVDQCIALFEPPLARVHLEIVQPMLAGQIDYMRNQLVHVVEDELQAGEQEAKDEASTEQAPVVHARPLLAAFQAANDAAVKALEKYADYLRGQEAGAKVDFAIGAAMFEKMLAAGEAVDLPIDQVLEVGQANLAANRAAFVETARQIDPGKQVQEVALHVSLDHPTAENLISDTAAMLEEIRQYLIDKQIITVPSAVRCLVRETPEFMRWGFAFMDTPGTFEQKATEAYYYVTPVEKDWTPEQQEEWLRRFNYHTLRDISVHEAYPGHYVHFLHASNVMSPVLKVFGSYSFIEGWAHYCEQMMTEQGFHGDTPMFRFAQLGEALLRNCRYVTSIMMHTGRMTLDEAVRFFMENGFMEELPARKEALRGTFDPGYLNYTLGKLLLLKLREDLQAREGDSFSLKSFHDRVLSFGAPPVPLIRKHLLGGDSGPVL